MAESLNFSIQLPVYPERVYRALLDGGEMKKITGQAAHIESRAGGKFSLLDGQVEGEYKTLTPHDRIIQSWRDASFPAESEVSEVEMVLEPTCTGSELKLIHTGIPDGQSQQVLKRWEEAFFRPLLRYFDELVGEYEADMSDG